MSTRTVIELNHDYLHELRKDPAHFQALLTMASSGALANVPNELSPSGDVGLPGIRILGQRHHSEKLELVVE